MLGNNIAIAKIGVIFIRLFISYFIKKGNGESYKQYIIGDNYEYSND